MTLPTGQQFSCRIELSQPNGITIVIKDSKQKDQLQKKIVLGPSSLVITCINGAKSSTITQTEDSLQLEVKSERGTTTVDQNDEAITVKCKTFTVDAETVTLKASQDGRLETGKTCVIKSTSDMTLDSSAKLSGKSVGALSLATDQSATVKATASLSLEGNQTEVKGTSQLDLQSSGTASLSAAAVSLSGKTQATLEAPLTSVGKNVTKITGQMVEVSGALVKLG